MKAEIISLGVFFISGTIQVIFNHITSRGSKPAWIVVRERPPFVAFLFSEREQDEQ